MQSLPNHGSSQKGFSLIDLTIALAVTGMVLATGFRAVDEALPRVQTKQAVHSIASAIRAARARAVYEKNLVVMPIDVQRGRYAVVSHTAPMPTERESVGGVVRQVAELPPGVRFLAPPGCQVEQPVGFLTPFSYEVAVAFDSRGRLLSLWTPGYLHVGHPERGLYWRVAVDLAGNVRTEQWEKDRWR